MADGWTVLYPIRNAVDESGYQERAGLTTMRMIRKRRSCRRHLVLLWCLILLVGTSVASGSEPAPIRSYASVQDDGTLVVGREWIRLHGIYIPETERRCRSWIRPVRCAERAVLQLDFKISGFVHCFPVEHVEDGSLDATCFVNRTSFREGEDLSAYLLRNGWALALPDAPFEYHAMERIARHRGLGLWGIPADSIRYR